MDLSTNTLSFATLCPPTLMHQLLHSQPTAVRALKKFQTTFSTRPVTYMCPVACPDPTVVRDVIQAIDGLEELSVVNYEADMSALWEGVFKQGETLRWLGVHSPPMEEVGVWTGEVVRGVGEGLPALRHLEMDISVGDAERCLEVAAGDHENGRVESVGGAQVPESISELTKLSKLESVVVNVNLPGWASAFAGEHTYNAMGSTSFPRPHPEPSTKVARFIFDKFQAASPDCSLKQLTLRFARRCYEDRGQFWTVACSFELHKGEGEVEVKKGGWGEYLPRSPSWGSVLGELVDQANMVRYAAMAGRPLQ